MKYNCFFALLFLGPLALYSQDSEPFTYEVVPGVTIRKIQDFEPESVPSDVSEVYAVSRAYPQPAGAKHPNKGVVNSMHQRFQYTHTERGGAERRTASEPIVDRGFSGALGGGIPNDNNIAVSPSGWVVSVLNTHVRVYDDQGDWKVNWSLTFFPNAPQQTAHNIPTLVRSYDPKIVYDHEADRFVLVYLEGSESSNTRIIVAFSKSSNPLDGWHVYQVEGNPIGGPQWSDYPVIGLSKEDLYVTVNILEDSTDWRDGFRQSVIWQIQKQPGYEGVSELNANLIKDIVYNNQPIWSICPIPGGYDLMERGMYFLSVRPGDVQNDTVFLHRLLHDYSGGPNPEYRLQVLKSDKPYGLPPDGFQPQEGFRLQSNDARVLSGFIHAGKIHFCQTTRNFANQRSAVYHGIISDVFGQPQVQAQIVSSDTLDLAYPSMVYAGDGGWNQNAVLTFSHTSENRFPGTSFVYFNSQGQYSDIVTLKEGQGLINTFLPDSMERWGDYTGIQRDYTQNGAFWTSGSFGNTFNRNDTWLNRVLVNDQNVSSPLKQTPKKPEVKAFPVPSTDVLNLQFAMPAEVEFTLTITDIRGVRVHRKAYTSQQEGTHWLRINTAAFASGTYFYQISTQAGNAYQVQGKFIKD